MKKLFFILGSLVFIPGFVSAHGIGEVYSLPVPLTYYLGGAGIAVAFSFFVIAFFLNKKQLKDAEEKRIYVPGLGFFVATFKIILFFFLLLTIATGIFGSQNPAENFAPLFFWVYFLIGLQLFSVLIGNIWEKVNPWKLISDWAVSDLKVKKSLVGQWIGPILILALFWFELASNQSFIPRYIGIIFALYTLVNIFASAKFYNWYKDGELFSRLFSFVGTLSRYKISEDNQYLVRVSSESSLRKDWAFSGLFLASVMLAGASFDSLKESVLWFKILKFVNIPFTQLEIANTLGIILAPLPFIISYLIIVWVINRITNFNNPKEIALRFIPSLVPIAFGYILAHNFPLFIASAKQMLMILSDPFGFGWNILSAATPDYGNTILGARTVWFVEIGLVVLAHIFGVFYAHVIALDVFKNPRAALKSQFPMMVLMVAYTVTTLWLLSQPLVTFE